MAEQKYLKIAVLTLAMASSVTSQDKTATDTTQQTPITINTYGSCSGVDGALEKRIAELEKTVREHQALLQGQFSFAGALFADDPGVDQQQTVQSTAMLKQLRIKDCSDIFSGGNVSSGIYTLSPPGVSPFFASCEFDQDGRWTVIQNRRNGSVDFQRNWVEYRKGFGNIQDNFWMGLDNIHAITKQRQYTARFTLTDWEGQELHAEYRDFQIGDENAKFKLSYSQYSGMMGDGLGMYHYHSIFSTFDQDNDNKGDENCALMHGGGWWYNRCDHANLNGQYHYNPNLIGPFDSGIEWNIWRERYSFKTSQIKIKPAFHD